MGQPFILLPLHRNFHIKKLNMNIIMFWFLNISANVQLPYSYLFQLQELKNTHLAVNVHKYFLNLLLNVDCTVLNSKLWPKFKYYLQHWVIFGMSVINCLLCSIICKWRRWADTWCDELDFNTGAKLDKTFLKFRTCFFVAILIIQILLLEGQIRGITVWIKHRSLHG